MTLLEGVSPYAEQNEHKVSAVPNFDNYFSSIFSAHDQLHWLLLSFHVALLSPPGLAPNQQSS